MFSAGSEAVALLRAQRLNALYRIIPRTKVKRILKKTGRHRAFCPLLPNLFMVYFVLTSTDTATFNAATGVVVTVDSTSQNIGSITFSGNQGTGAYNISGNPLYLTAGGTITDSNAGAGTELIASPLTLEGAYTVTNSALSSGLTLGGAITGSNLLTISGAGATASATAAINVNGSLANFTGTFNVSTGAYDKVNMTVAGTQMSSGTINIGTSSTSTSTFYTNLNWSSGVAFNVYGAGNSEGYGALRVDGTTGVIAGPVTLETSNATIGSQTSTGIISGPIGGVGSAGLTKVAGGALTLSGINTYTGLTTVSAGTLTVTGNESAANGGFSIDPTNAGAVTATFSATSTIAVSSASGIQVGDAAGAGGSSNNTLSVSGVVNNAGSLEFDRTSVVTINSGGVWNQSGSTAALNGEGGYSAAMTVASGGLFNYTGTSPFQINGAFQNSGTSTVVISGTFDTGQAFTSATETNSSGGTLNIAGGALVLTASIPQLATNTISATPNSGTLNVIFGAGGANINTSGFSTTIALPVSGTGGLTVTGGGTVTLTAANTFTGAVNASGGTLDLYTGNAIADAVLNGSTGIVFDSNVSSHAFSIGALNGSYNLTETDSAANPFALTLGGGNVSGVFTGALLGGTNLVKIGTGTQSLAGNNTYTGTTNVSAGTLEFVNEASLYSGVNAAWNASNITVGSGGTLAFAVGGSGQFTLTDIATLLTNLDLYGNSGFESGSAIGIDDASALSLATPLVNPSIGTIGLQKLGAGTLTLSGASTYTGATTVSAGTLTAGVASTATSGPFGVNSAVTTANIAGAGLALNGYNVSVGSLAGGGSTGGGIALGANNLTIGGNNTTTSYAGVISGTGGLVKTGTGTQTLSAANTYTGLTNLSGGGLTVTGSLASTSAVAFTNTTVLNYSPSAGGTQTLGALTFNAGAGTVTATQGSSGTNITFSSYGGRAVGATANYTTTNTSNSKITLTGQPAGFIDQGSFFNSAGYAWMNSSGGYVRAINYGVDTGSVTTAGGTSLASATYQQFTAAVTNQSTATFTTLADSGAFAMNLAAGATVTTNGIETNSTVTFTGGTGFQASSGAELVIRTDANTLTLTSPILANGTNALTKTGTGTLALTGTNTNSYTGPTFVDAGTLQLLGTNSNSNDDSMLALNKSSGVTVYSGATLAGYRSYSGGGNNEVMHLPTVTLDDGSKVTTGSSNGSLTYVFSNPWVIAGNVSIQQTSGGYSNALTSSGAISGFGTINLSGSTGSSHSFTFSGASPSYSGNWTATGSTSVTAVSATAANALGTGTFTLNVNSSLGTTVATGLNSLSGVVLAAANTTLNGPYGWNNPAATVTMTSGTFNVGTSSTSGNVSIGSLTQTGGTVNLYSNATSANPLILAGNYNYAGGSIVVNFTQNPTAPSYTLVNYGGTLTSDPTVNLGAFASSYNVSYGAGTNSSITISQSGSSSNLIWTGDISNAWDVNTTQNWNNSSTLMPQVFHNLDNVTFDDTATSFNVNIASGTSVYPGSMTFNNSTNAYTVTGTGVIAGSGSLLKMGTNTLTISTPNTFTGGTTISNGTMIVGANTALGASSGAVTLGDSNTGSGAVTLQLNSGITVANPITVSNQSAATFTVFTTGTATDILSGAIILNQNVTFNSSNTTVPVSSFIGATLANTSTIISGSITGTGGMTFTGGETFDVYTGTNTYSGQTIVTGNSLVQFGSSVSTDPNTLLNISSGSTVVVTNLGSGKFGGLIGGGTFYASNQGTSTVTIGSLNDSADNFTGLVTGPFTLIKSGTGTQIFSGPNTFTGTLNVSGGVMQAGAATVSGVSGPFGLNVAVQLANTAGVSLILNNYNVSVGSLATGGTTGGGVNLGSGTLTLTGSTSTSYAGLITGTGGLVVSNSATQTLTGQSTFSGGTTITSGTVAIASTTPTSGTVTSGPIGTGSLNLSGGTVISSGTAVIANPLVVTAATTTAISDSSGGDLTLNGAITGSGTLSINSTVSNSVWLGGDASGFTGTLLFNDNSAGANVRLLSTNFSQAAFNLSGATTGRALFSNASSGATIQIGALSGTGGALGGIAGSYGVAAIFQIGALGINTTFGGLLSNPQSGANSLTKVGIGSLALSGANTYSGGTNLSAGTLVVSNTTGSATGTGAVTLNGGILASGVTGIISGNVSSGSGANEIAPGGMNGSIGTLSVGGLTTTSLTMINFDLGAGPATNISGNSVVTNGDLLNVGSGATNIGSGTQITLGTSQTPVAGDDYRLFAGSGIGSMNLSNFSLPTAAGLALSLSATVDPSYIDLVVVTGGPANLTYLNANGTFDTGTSASFNGSSGPTVFNTGDNVTFDDTYPTGPYTVPISGTVAPGSTTFNNSAGNYVVTGVNSSSGIAGTGSLTKYGTGSVTLSTSNTYTGGTFVNAGTLILAGANAFPANTGLNVSAGAQVTIANHSSNAAYVPTVSTLANSGTIDITNNAMVITNASIGTISAQVAAAYNNGSWSVTNTAGGLITSSVAAGDPTHLTAVGVGTGFSSFEGSNVSSSSVLVKYTYYGDANLDGQVDGTDYSRIDNGYLNRLTGWYNGDFNYDGVIDGSDYTLIDNSYNTQGANIAAEVGGAVATAQIAGGSAVPEPATFGIIGIGVVGLLGRRSRRRAR